MTACLGKNCSFSLPCVSFVIVYQYYVCASFSFSFEGRMWDLIVLVPNHCNLFYFLFSDTNSGFYVRFSWQYVDRHHYVLYMRQSLFYF